MKRVKKITDAEYLELEKTADSGPMTTEVLHTAEELKIISKWAQKSRTQQTVGLTLKTTDDNRHVMTYTPPRTEKDL